MKSLIVHLHGERTGLLEQEDGDPLRFIYDPAWLAKPDAVPLSRSLPLQSEAFPAKKARPFFAGLLPEEEPRKIVAKILGISAANDFALLERIGGECAGAVQLLPAETELAAQISIPPRELSAAELEQIVAELPRRPLLAGRDGLRLSLAGAQDKLPVLIRDGCTYLPLDDLPSSHVLKPEPARFSGLAANEWFALALARAVGLDVPAAEFRIIGETPCLLVARYDRRAGADGRLRRIHQEDFCQALGFPPERKYQAENGPTLRHCFELLRTWSTVPARDVPAFIDGLIFNVLIGNADAHAKNFSLLYIDGERRLAPFYDLVSTLAWPELTAKPAMKIGHADSLDVFASAEWKILARETGLAWPLLRERLNLSARAVQEHLDFVLAHAPAPAVATVRPLGETIRARADRMQSALATNSSPDRRSARSTPGSTTEPTASVGHRVEVADPD